MNISYNNRLANATLSATNENLNRPVSNIIHNYLEKAFFAIQDNTVITAILDDTYSFDHVAIGYHNLNSMIIRFYNSLDLLISSEIIDITYENDIYYFDNTIENVKKIVFECETLQDTVRIGKIFIGEYLELPNFVMPLAGEHFLSGVTYTSKDGQRTGSRHRCYCTFTLSFNNITHEERNLILNYLYEVQNVLPHFIDLYPENHEKIQPLHVAIESTNIGFSKKRISDFKWLYEEITYRMVY